MPTGGVPGGVCPHCGGPLDAWRRESLEHLTRTAELGLQVAAQAAEIERQTRRIAELNRRIALLRSKCTDAS